MKPKSHQTKGFNGRFWTKPETYLLVLGWVSLIFLLLNVPGIFQRLVSPVQLSQSDAINVERALILLRGDPLYPDSSQGGPYLYTAYPPLFFWLESGLLKIFHTNIWMPGRFLAYAGYIGSGFLLLCWGWKKWGFHQGFFAGLTLLICPSWVLWGTLDRCDTLSVFLGLAAFLILYRQELGEKAPPKASMTPVLFAGLILFAAVLVKQSAITLVPAYGIYCLYKRYWKRLSWFLGASLIPLTAFTLFENARTQGLYWKHTVVWLNYGYHTAILWDWLKGDFLSECGFLMAALGILMVLKKVHPLVWIRLVFSAFSLVSLGRVGGSSNYWLEFFLLLLFTVGEGIWDSPWKKFSRSSWAFPALCFVLVCFILNFNHALQTPRPQAPGLEVYAMKKEVLPLYGPGEHLAVDSDLPLMAGKKIWIEPMEYTAMVEKGFWKTESLIREIRNKKFDTIELYDLPRQYLLPQPVVDEINLDYHPVLKKYGRVWLAPNP